MANLRESWEMAKTDQIKGFPNGKHMKGASASQEKAIFFDRDGTLIQHREYLTEISDIQLFDETWKALRLLNQHQIKSIVVTNQSAIARGLLSEGELMSIHSEIQSQLECFGASLNSFYYCPHHPTEGNGTYRKNCLCRKPQPGLIVRAANDLGLSLAHSFMVGDSESDIEAGKRAGCRTVLITNSSYQRDRVVSWSEMPEPDFEATDILSAVNWILGEIIERS